MTARKIAYAVGSAAGQGLMTGLWIAASELSPAKRRAVRFAAGASIVAVGYLWPAKDTATDAARRAEREIEDTVYRAATAGGTTGDDAEDDAEESGTDKRKLALKAGVAVLSLAAMAGRHQLEKRWLARLERQGHPHPHRALGLRMGLISAAIALPSRLQGFNDR